MLKKTCPVLLTGGLFVDGILKTLPCVEKSTVNSTLREAESANYLVKKKPHFCDRGFVELEMSGVRDSARGKYLFLLCCRISILGCRSLTFFPFICMYFKINSFFFFFWKAVKPQAFCLFVCLKSFLASFFPLSASSTHFWVIHISTFGFHQLLNISFSYFLLDISWLIVFGNL